MTSKYRKGSVIARAQRATGSSSAAPKLNPGGSIGELEELQSQLSCMVDLRTCKDDAFEKLVESFIMRCASLTEMRLESRGALSKAELTWITIACQYYSNECLAKTVSSSSSSSLADPSSGGGGGGVIISSQKDLFAEERRLMAIYTGHVRPDAFATKLLLTKKRLVEATCDFVRVLHARSSLHLIHKREEAKRELQAQQRQQQQQQQQETKEIPPSSHSSSSSSSVSKTDVDLSEPLNNKLISEATNYFYWQFLIVYLVQKYPVRSIADYMVPPAVTPEDKKEEEACGGDDVKRTKLGVKRMERLIQQYESALNELIGYRLCSQNSEVEISAKQRIMDRFLPLGSAAKRVRASNEYDVFPATIDIMRTVLSDEEIRRCNQVSEMLPRTPDEQAAMPPFVLEAWRQSGYENWLKQVTCPKFPIEDYCISWESWVRPTECIAKFNISRSEGRPLPVQLGCGAWLLFYKDNLYKACSFQSYMAIQACYFLLMAEDRKSILVSGYPPLPSLDKLRDKCRAERATVELNVKRMKASEKAFEEHKKTIETPAQREAAAAAAATASSSSTTTTNSK